MSATCALVQLANNCSGGDLTYVADKLSAAATPYDLWSYGTPVFGGVFSEWYSFLPLVYVYNILTSLLVVLTFFFSPSAVDVRVRRGARLWASYIAYTTFAVLINQWVDIVLLSVTNWWIGSSSTAVTPRSFR